MAKVTAADLKKHHYWILAGVAPLLTLLAAMFLWLNVGSDVAAKAAETDKAIKDVQSVNPKGKKAITEDYPKQETVLEDQKKKLWEKNYDEQKAMFVWPRNERLQGLQKRYTKFGQEIKGEDEARQQLAKLDVYEKAYDDLSREVTPTTFAGGWKGVLRYVANWGELIPTDKQLWLALEDLWVQRGLLLPVNDINAAAGRFDLLKPADGKDDPFKRTFQSRLWTLELELPKQATGGQRLITGRLTNRTDRLQALGEGNEMKLMLRVAPSGSVPEVFYRIQSQGLVPARQTIEVRVQTSEKPTPERKAKLDKKELVEFPATNRNHGIPPGIEPTGLLAVRQLLDARNVPVRRIDQVVMGSRAKDARHNTAEMLAPKWYPADAAPATPSGDTGTGGLPGRGGMPGGGPPGGEGMAPPAMGGGFGAMFGGQGGGGGPSGVLDGNKLRYVTVTDQVRRMPVALVLVMDQMFVQDALAAYANSPLRFQVTQYHWTRFRGTLDSGTPVGGGSPFGGSGGRPGMGSPDGGSPDGGDVGSSGGGGMGSAGPPGMSGGFGGMMGGFGGTGTVSEEQVTSGLVSLTIYGIVTLYEKYTPPEGGTPVETPPPAAPPVDPPVAPPASPAAPTPPTGGTPATGKQ